MQTHTKFRRIPFFSLDLNTSNPTNQNIDLSEEELNFELKNKQKILDVLFNREIQEEDEDVSFFE